MSNAVVTAFAPRLLTWFGAHGRHDLPWQHPRTPYRVWLSEIMLQQTQVAVVIDYFQRFTTALPSLPALAAAPLDDVLGLWSGLGYYTRARNLHAAAKQCMHLHDGDLPRDLDALIALPGIGRSTAGAILSQAWGDAAPILDGNVKRVLCRLFGISGWPGTPAVEKQLWEIANQLLPSAHLADYTQAQMDFGATLCTRSNPSCHLCPLQDLCSAYQTNRTRELPTPKPKKALPQRSVTQLLLKDAMGHIFLQRRAATGIWAQLWSLPEFDTADDAQQWLQQHYGKTLQNAQPLPTVAHSFSHYRLNIQPHLIVVKRPALRISDNDNQRWIAPSDLPALGLPAPVKKLLQE